jgi:16S rRNA (guanine527-N7)-methyltransferase
VTSRDFQERLARRAWRAGVDLPLDLGARLEIYYRLLAIWNQKINLTGLNLFEPTSEALDRLLIEPVVAAKYAPAGVLRMIDIGSGGGSPAIPFALAVPGAQLLMVESKVRKSVFLREALRALDIQHGEVATFRFEELQDRSELAEAHDLLTVRAVRIAPAVLVDMQRFVKPGGQLFLFRGADETTAEPSLPMAPLRLRATHVLVESLRSRLVVLEKLSET